MAVQAPERQELLSEGFGGVLTGPDDQSYEELRRCHNGMVDKRPALIACCRGAADVARAVRFAVDEGLEVAVRGGGHNVAGRSDVRRRARGGPLAHARCRRRPARAHRPRAGRRALGGRQPRGACARARRSPAGSSRPQGSAATRSAAGSAGSWVSAGSRSTISSRPRSCSPSGEIVRASEAEHPDLFWALRGGGGNFGVVTSFVFRLHPVAEVVGGLVAHPFEKAGDLLRFYREFTRRVPDDLTV